MNKYVVENKMWLKKLLSFILCFVLKDAAFNLVLRVILSIKTSEIEKTIAQLDRDQIDMLMKYVYKGFENPSEGRSAHLLAWHEKVNILNWFAWFPWLLRKFHIINIYLFSNKISMCIHAYL